MSKTGLIFAGVLIGVMLSLGGGWWFLQKKYTYQGVLIDPPAHAPNFNLTDQHGDSFQLLDQQGKVVLIFFGYTHCPDVCPITLSEYKRVKAILGDQSENVQFVYITVDPERDTQERMRVYLQNFDPDFIGLTGSRPELELVWQKYGVYQQRQDTGSAAGYLIDHSARIYAIDKMGNWILNYPYGMEPDRIAQDVTHLLKQPSQ